MAIAERIEVQMTPKRATQDFRFKPRTVCLSGAKHLHLDWVVCSKPLSSATCDWLISLGQSFPEEKATVVGQEKLQGHRVGCVHMMPGVPETLPVYQLLWDTAVDAAQR